MTMNAFNLFLGIMSLIALIVFIVLYFVKAGSSGVQQADQSR